MIVRDQIFQDDLNYKRAIEYCGFSRSKGSWQHLHSSKNQHLSFDRQALLFLRRAQRIIENHTAISFCL